MATYVAPFASKDSLNGEGDDGVVYHFRSDAQPNLLMQTALTKRSFLGNLIVVNLDNVGDTSVEELRNKVRAIATDADETPFHNTDPLNNYALATATAEEPRPWKERLAGTGAFIGLYAETDAYDNPVRFCIAAQSSLGSVGDDYLQSLTARGKLTYASVLEDKIYKTLKRQSERNVLRLAANFAIQLGLYREIRHTEDDSGTVTVSPEAPPELALPFAHAPFNCLELLENGEVAFYSYATSIRQSTTPSLIPYFRGLFGGIVVHSPPAGTTAMALSPPARACVDKTIDRFLASESGKTFTERVLNTRIGRSPETVLRNHCYAPPPASLFKGDAVRPPVYLKPVAIIASDT